MIRILLITLLFIGFNSYSIGQTITPENLEALAGKWSGTYTYTDHNDNESRYRLSTTMKGTWKSNKLILSFVYTEASGDITTSKFTLKHTDDEQEFYMNGTWSVSDFKTQGKGWTLVLEKSGKDNNIASILQQTVVYANNELSIIKNVRHDGEESFFERNKFSVTRD